jgi:microfibrillar-associated protein 1
VVEAFAFPPPFLQCCGEIDGELLRWDRIVIFALMSSRRPPPPTRPKVVRHFRKDEEDETSSEEEQEEELDSKVDAEDADAGEEKDDLKSPQLEPTKKGITIQKVQLPKKETAGSVKKEEEESSSEGEYVTEEEEDEEEEKHVSKPAETKPAEPKKERSEEEESSSEEEESESESDSPEPPKFSRPVFVKKGQRKEKTQTPEPAKVDNHQETLKLVEQSIKNERALEAAKFGEDDDIYIVDDTDDLDPAAEKAAWKLRELQRIERERNEMAARERELEENEERRNRTTEEIAAEAREKQKKQQEEKQKRAKMKFMQKYYHRGAFYQDEELLKQRDFNVAVEDDYQDKSVLPKPLQVRSGLGLKGQTKYRGLREEDTTLQSPTKKRKTND